MEAERSESDHLFRAFAESGDPRALGEVYDLLAPELLRIALHTARDAAEAEDVLQATFVAAIERARHFDPGQRVLPWLVGILANESRKARARAVRRPDPERIELRESAGPEADAERTELLALLDGAVERVPEAFRPVLQLRLRHGLSVTEIGAALGRPSGTVRSQLARGTECLRRSLPASLAGALALVATPTRGLAAVREAVLEQATLLHGPVQLSTAIGGLLAVKKLVTLAALLVAGLLLWRVQRTEPLGTTIAAEPPAESPPEEKRAELEPHPEPAPEREPLAAGPALEPHQPPAAVSGGRLVVHARWPDGTLAAGETVLATPPSARHEETLSRITDESGTARFDGLEAGPWYVRLLRGREDSARLRDGSETDLTLQILDGVTVEGVVVDRQGEPVAGAEVWLSERYRNNAGHTVAYSNARGAFTLGCVGPDHWIGARKRGFAPSTLRGVRGESGERLALELRLEQGGAPVTGRVLDTRGQPIPDAFVLLGEEWPASVRVDDGSFVPAAPPQRARTCEDGRFELATVALGPRPWQARARGFAPLAGSFEVLEGTPNELPLTLLPEARVVGRVRGPGDRPLAEVWIHTDAPERFASASDFSRLDGRFELPGLGGRVSLVAEHAEHGRAECEFDLRPGETREWQVELRTSPRIAGQIFDAHGEALAGVIVVALLPDDHEQRVRSNVSAADGRFAITDLAERPYLVWVQPAQGWREFPLLEVENVWPDGAPLELHVPDDAERARITAEVVACDGTPVAGAELQVWHQERRIFRGFVSTAERGAVLAEGVPPGTVDLELRHPAHPWKHLGTYTLEPGADLDLGLLPFEPSGRLRVRISGLPDERIAALSVTLIDAFNREAGVARLAAGELTAGPLAPGEHVLVLSADGLRQVRRPFRIEPGAEATFELALEPCATRDIVFTLPDGAPKPQWIGCSLFDAQGALIWGGHADCEREVPLARTSAPPGSYRLVAGTRGELRGEAELLMGAPGAVMPPLSVPLRREP